jgi:hypothetical protein
VRHFDSAGPKNSDLLSELPSLRLILVADLYLIAIEPKHSSGSLNFDQHLDDSAHNSSSIGFTGPKY